ncbi:MAG: maltose acetyltransferase domain-containing protein [Eubacterium sp.]
MYERMKAWYLWTDTGEYMEEQACAKDLMYEFNHTKPCEEQKRNELIKEIFGSVGGPVWIMQPITSLARGKTVHIGKGTFINSGLTLMDGYEVYIGENCLLATNVTICTTGHPVHPELRAHGEMYSFPVKIGNNVWIGATEPFFFPV